MSHKRTYQRQAVVDSDQTNHGNIDSHANSRRCTQAIARQQAIGEIISGHLTGVEENDTFQVLVDSLGNFVIGVVQKWQTRSQLRCSHEHARASSQAGELRIASHAIHTAQPILPELRHVSKCHAALDISGQRHTVVNLDELAGTGTELGKAGPG